MPRLLQVVHRLEPGGTERLVIELARRLHADLPHAVCCLDEPGEWAGEVEAAGIQVTALRRGPGFRPSLARGVAAAARAHGATVLHAHQYSPFVYSALARLVRPGLRVVFTEHGRLSGQQPSPKRRLANRALRHLATRVFTVSEDVKQHLVAEGFRADEIAVIYNGIDVGPLPDASLRAAVRQELGLSGDEVAVATIARLDPVKNLGVLVDAVTQLAAAGRPVALVVIGDGPERAALAARAAAAGPGNRIRFLGHRDDARRWLAGCDVYANSSASEGVSLTILEAMAAGLPVVATAVGGTPEVVTGDCGMLVPAGDAAALAGAIDQLGRNADGRRQLGRTARTRVEARFTLQRMVDDYRRIYFDAAPSSRRCATAPQ